VGTQDFLLYGALRSGILSRHFALGRYFRADQLSIFNHLGVVQQAGSGTPKFENDAVHGCLWSPGQASLVQPSTYANAAGLQALPPGQPLFERWRVGDHDRANPLMYSGQLMVCLAVETTLGIPGSLDILSRLLATIGSLFKYDAPPFDGYILRYDPVTSDHWTTRQGEGGVSLGDCCDFLIDSDRPGGYLYCTPLDDPRYVPYMAQSTFDKLSNQQDWQNKRQLSEDMTRGWEPSLDELTGLIAGYSFVNTVVSDPGIQAQVTDQVKRLAGYLAANAYYLVRPEGGFCSQGAQSMAPAVEYPFGRVFSRITGSAFASQTNFEGAVKNARLWSQLGTGFNVGTVAGPVAGVLLAALMAYLGSILGGVLGSIIYAVGGVTAFIGLVGGGAIAKALALYFNYEAFDVRAWPGAKKGHKPPAERDNSEQTAFSVAYLVGQLPRKTRFTASLKAMGGTLFGIQIGGYSQNFPPFFGLTAFNDSDQTVRNAYLGWLAARRASNDPPTATAANNDAFASAVAVILGSGQAEQSTLVSILQQMKANIDGPTVNDDLTIYNDNTPYDGTSRVTESVLSTGGEPNPNKPGLPMALNFMSALALAWYYSKTQADAGTPVPPSLGFPTPPPAGSTLPAATIPAAVIQVSYGNTPAQVIPLGGLGPLPDPLAGDIDLFSSSAPRKPANPPPPVTVVRWQYTSPITHSGNVFGGIDTDTINSGKQVPPGCIILGVKVQLVYSNGNPLGDLGTTTTIGRPDAVVGSWPFTAGAGIISDGTGTTDETVTVRWWYSIGRACRYRIGYLIQFPDSEGPPPPHHASLPWLSLLLG
jgi:hypothetical protein